VQFTLCYAATGLDQPVGQRRFSMVDMGDDAEVSNMFHGFVLPEIFLERCILPVRRCSLFRPDVPVDAGQAVPDIWDKSGAA